LVLTGGDPALHGPLEKGDLRERLAQHVEVIGGGVRAGVARPRMGSG